MPSTARSNVIRIVVMLCTAMLVLAAVFTAPGAEAASGCYGNEGDPTVALDPGHGGSDPGARYVFDDGRETLYERDLNLDIAERTAKMLVGQGYRVCLTRIDSASNPSNTQRAQYANSVGASVFVLIHLNGSNDPTINYTQTFWGKKNKDLEFSRVMYNALYRSLGIPGNGVGQFASGALLKSNMPATLTESVFLTNHDEAERLYDESTPGNRRDQIAQALANGIRTWLNR